jgi:hypothetical protein
MLQSRLRTFNIYLSIHLYANGALSEIFTPLTGRGRLSTLQCFRNTNAHPPIPVLILCNRFLFLLNHGRNIKKL